MTIERRSIVKGAAWSAPVILFGTAAPAAAASHEQPPVVPLCIPGDVLLVEPLPGQTFKTNEGQGNTLVMGDGVQVTNTGEGTLRFVVGFWTNAGQVGLLTILGNDDITLEAPKDGNKATVNLWLLPGQTRTLKVATDTAATKAEAHLLIDCQRFIFKSTETA